MDYSELNSIVKTLPHDMPNDFSGPSLEKAAEHINNKQYGLFINDLKIIQTRPFKYTSLEIGGA